MPSPLKLVSLGQLSVWIVCVLLAANIGGLPDDANLAGIRIHVYDRAGREITRHSLEH